MNKKALETEILGKILLVLLALAVLAWILFAYVIKPLLDANLGI